MMRFSTDIVQASLLFAALAVGSAQDAALEKVIVSYQTELSAVAHSSKSVYCLPCLSWWCAHSIVRVLAYRFSRLLLGLLILRRFISWLIIFSPFLPIRPITDNFQSQTQTMHSPILSFSCSRQGLLLRTGT